MKTIFKKSGLGILAQFDPSLIAIDSVVRGYCEQNACGQYGKNHMCPPSVKSIDKWKQEIMSFGQSLMVSKVYSLKSSFDMAGMQEGIIDFGKRLRQARDKFRAENPGSDSLVLGAGPCTVCKTCSCLDNEPCRLPDEAVVSVEACGIDVVGLCKTLEQKYHHGKNTVTYFGLALF